jgi:mono/diheme cytochrome c family protein
MTRLAPAALLAAVTHAPAQTVDFNRDVRPILSEHCFACHGPDEKTRKAKLRLDTKDGALAFAVVPGKPEKSELFARVTTDDEAELMPPPRTGKKLTAAQVETLKKWIAGGAKWGDHWAFVRPARPDAPRTRERWGRNPIDAFVLARLERENLTPSPEASRETLIRRVTLDLTGLPPTLAEIDTFLKDTSPDAYEKVVDRLLASPRYGERMAVEWLDAARYADTHGYHIDSGRDMTRWREYVINAFNANKPFDQFTIEQLAGDLIPNATTGQKIASGFNRNHMINFEGGAIPAEYQTAYIVDRVNTTATVWLGLTAGCAQCHDHKYDPISQKDYYRLYAFFNNVPENGLDGQKGNAVPVLKLPTPEQDRKVKDLKHVLAALEAEKGELPKAGGVVAGAAVVALAAGFDKRIAAARTAVTDAEKSIPDAMVMSEMAKPRDTHVLVRGAYDKKGEKVTAGVPDALPPLQAANPTRLDLAKWLVSSEQPLTARVIVNRYWQMYFGNGIVKTSDDFGSQGEWPTHPELLDWLACEFTSPSAAFVGRAVPDTGSEASGTARPPTRSAPQPWDVKHIQRLIVTSATYRQSSRVTPELLAKDPENRLFARSSRLRLQAEFLRDQALAVGGLLNGEIGGKSVSPYQPPGLWEELAFRLDNKNFSAQVYEPSKGKDLYRRTMYTFWKRTSPPPALVTLDAPDREVCTVRRPRTNTPLQALVLMNDPTYVEAARKLAERVLAEGGKTAEERIAFAFRACAGRKPTERETGILKKVFDAQLTRYRADPGAAAKLLAVGESPRDAQADAAELAAWAVVCSAVLNLDEVVTRN